MKKIGNKIYIHHSALDTLPLALQDKINKAWEAIQPVRTFHYDVVKVSINEDDVTFLWSPDFNTSHEPRVACSIKVTNGKQSPLRTESEENPSIYHGKHFFVKPDYTGFNVEEAKKRYEAWKNSNIPETKDISRIGRKKYWQEIVIPRLIANGIIDN